MILRVLGQLGQYRLFQVFPGYSAFYYIPFFFSHHQISFVTSPNIPILGLRVYHLRYVCINWTEFLCGLFLTHLKTSNWWRNGFVAIATFFFTRSHLLLIYFIRLKWFWSQSTGFHRLLPFSIVSCQRDPF